MFSNGRIDAGNYSKNISFNPTSPSTPHRFGNLPYCRMEAQTTAYSQSAHSMYDRWLISASRRWSEVSIKCTAQRRSTIIVLHQRSYSFQFAITLSPCIETLLDYSHMGGLLTISLLPISSYYHMRFLTSPECWVWVFEHRVQCSLPHLFGNVIVRRKWVFCNIF